MGQTQSSGGRKGGQLGDKLRPLGRAAPVAHRWGVFSSKGEAAGWNRKQGSLGSIFKSKTYTHHVILKFPPTYQPKRLECLWAAKEMYKLYIAAYLY